MNTSIQPYQFTIDSAINEWVTVKKQRTNSAKTETAYRDTIESFRAFIAPHYDLLDSPIDIARIASIWAARRLPDDERKPSHRRGNADEPVTPGSYNQRLAILSSWYAFVQETYKLDIINPMKADSIERRPVQAYAAATALNDEDLENIASIDRSTLEGLRDYALIAVALSTGRRAGELVGLRWRHLEVTGKREKRVTLTFEHCKGDKTMRDKLDEENSAILLEYLHAHYGKNLLQLPSDAAIWVSYSRQNYGKPISTKTLSNLCLAVFDTGKVHTLRHTFSAVMMESDAPITELADRLGHTDIKITQAYAKRLRGAENPYSTKLTARYGLTRYKNK